MATKYLETCATVSILKPDGQTDLQVIVETKKKPIDVQIAEITAKATEKGYEAELVKQQTFEYTEPQTWDEITELVPDETVRLEHFVRGFTLSQQKERRTFMLSDEEAREGSFDLLPEVQEPKVRRKADPRSAAFKALKDLLGVNLDSSAFDAVLAQFQAAAQAQG